MNGIDRIVERIESDARLNADEILAQADKQCEQIRAEYDKQAQEKYSELLRAGIKDCELRVQRMAGAAEMEAKKSVLALKQKLVSRAFDRAQELVCHMPADEYTEFLTRMAVFAVRTGGEEVIFNEKDKAGCAAKVVERANARLKENGLRGALTVSGETRPIIGGLIVRESNIETNCSIEVLTNTYRNELSSQVAEVLFQ